MELTFTRLRIRSLSLRPGNLLTPLYGALSMGFKRQRFPHLLPSSYMALAFCHGGTCTRKCVRPFAGHAKKKDLTLIWLLYHIKELPLVILDGCVCAILLTETFRKKTCSAASTPRVSG